MAVESIKGDCTHALVQVLDDLKGSVDAGSCGDGFQEGIVPFLAMESLENILVATSGITGRRGGEWHQPEQGHSFFGGRSSGEGEARHQPNTILCRVIR